MNKNMKDCLSNVGFIFDVDKNIEEIRKICTEYSISYEENVLQNDNDYRTNGFGNLKYAMGNFKNDIFGDYIRYTHASPAIHMLS